MKASSLTKPKLINPNRKNILYSVSFMLFVDAIGYGIIFPVLPQLLFNEHTGLILGESSNRAYFYSLVLAIYPIMNFFGMSFWGKMSDKYGRKRILLAGLGGLTASYFLAPIAIIEHSLILFIVYRILCGFLGGIYSVGNAVASDVSGKEEKSRLSSFSLTTVASRLGMTIGPALSIFVVANVYFDNEFVIPFVITALLGFLNTLLLLYNFRHLPNQTTKHHSDETNQIKWSLWSQLIQLFNAVYLIFTRKETKFLAASSLAFQFGAALFMQGLSLYLTVEYHYTPTHIGFFISMMGLILVFSIYGLSKILSKYFECAVQLQIALAILIALFLYGFFIQNTGDSFFAGANSSILGVWLIAGIFHLLYPIVNVGFRTLFSEAASDDEQGMIMGAAGQLSALSAFCSAIFVGFAALNHLIILVTGFTIVLSFWFIVSYFTEDL